MILKIVHYGRTLFGWHNMFCQAGYNAGTEYLWGGVLDASVKYYNLVSGLGAFGVGGGDMCAEKGEVGERAGWGGNLKESLLHFSPPTTHPAPRPAPNLIFPQVMQMLFLTVVTDDSILIYSSNKKDWQQIVNFPFKVFQSNSFSLHHGGAGTVLWRQRWQVVRLVPVITPISFPTGHIRWTRQTFNKTKYFEKIKTVLKI